MFRDFDFSSVKGLHQYSSIDEACNDFKKYICDVDVLTLKYYLTQDLKTFQFILREKYNENVSAYDLLFGLEVEGATIPLIILVDYFDNSKLAITYPLFSFLYITERYMEYFKKLNLPVENLGDCHYVTINRPGQYSFRDWLSTCKQKYYSHFYGAKSQKIGWFFTHSSSPIGREAVCDTFDANIQHNELYIEKYGENNFLTHYYDSLPWSKPIDNSTYYVYGRDLDTNKCVALMYVYIFGDTAHLNEIATCKNPEYKPYGLVLAAHYAAIKYMFWDYQCSFKHINKVDLGLNFDHCADYKDSMRPYSIPVQNVPTFTNFEELKTILRLK